MTARQLWVVGEEHACHIHDLSHHDFAAAMSVKRRLRSVDVTRYEGQSGKHLDYVITMSLRQALEAVHRLTDLLARKQWVPSLSEGGWYTNVTSLYGSSMEVEYIYHRVDRLTEDAKWVVDTLCGSKASLKHDLHRKAFLREIRFVDRRFTKPTNYLKHNRIDLQPLTAVIEIETEGHAVCLLGFDFIRHRGDATESINNRNHGLNLTGITSFCWMAIAAIQSVCQALNSFLQAKNIDQNYLADIENAALGHYFHEALKQLAGLPLYSFEDNVFEEHKFIIDPRSGAETAHRLAGNARTPWSSFKRVRVKQFVTSTPFSRSSIVTLSPVIKLVSSKKYKQDL